MTKFTLATYLTVAALLALTLPDAIGFREQWHTFYWDAAYCHDMLQQDGGFGQLVSDFFTQFLAKRWTAALMLAVPCAVAGAVLMRLLRPLLGKAPSRNKSLGWALAVLLLTAAGSYLTLCLPHGEDRFKGMMCQVEDEEWDAIIGQCQGHRLNNQLELNILNMALAEKGQLQQRLMQQPCTDVNALFVLKIGSPYVAALLSDIYWTMGEISMSQMYAFEANEKMGNLSPRLLKRLVLTNIAFGHYEVAAKYLNWLDKTLFYDEWSAHYRQLLNDEAVAADPQLRLKRGCIPTENVFPSAQSVVYDLQQILANNPEHRPSAEYLGALKQLYRIE